MKFDDPWIDGYIKKLEKENTELKQKSFARLLELENLQREYNLAIAANKKLEAANQGWVNKVTVNEQTINGLLDLDDQRLRKIEALTKELEFSKENQMSIHDRMMKNRV